MGCMRGHRGLQGVAGLQRLQAVNALERVALQTRKGNLAIYASRRAAPESASASQS